MVSLHPKVVGLWRLQGGIQFLLFAGPASATAGVVLAHNIGTWSIIFPLLFALFELIRLMVWPMLAYDHFRYQIRERDLLIERGVLFRTTSCIPLDRIQHIDTNQGAIERTLGLFQVVIYTAAGLSADAIIPGLDQETAQQLRDQLARSRGDDGV